MASDPLPSLPAEVLETHVSTIFLVGDRAYKLKRPMQTPFLDYSTREARLAACEAEVALNRRIAPDVYLGVASILDPDGQLCDHLVVMKRMPPERRLSRLASTGRLKPSHVTAVARQIARFHSTAVRSAEINVCGTPDHLNGLWSSTLQDLSRFAGRLFDQRDLDSLGADSAAYVRGRHPLLAHRIDTGAIVDGHGDLLADDIWCLDDGPRICDCLEFDPMLRGGDVVADMAFLAMDLERIAGGDWANVVFENYRRFTAETHPRSLEEYYIAYRALVRAKVSCMLLEQRRVESARAAIGYLDQARRHLNAARVCAVMVGGLPGSGKSTVANSLGERYGWVVLRSDEMRKEMAGLSSTTPAGAAVGAGIYDQRHTEATYVGMMNRAQQLLAMGESVILDATWADASHRAAMSQIVHGVDARLVELRCDVDPSIAARRISQRQPGGDASDADQAVLEHFLATFESWSTAGVVDCGDDSETAEARAATLIGRPVEA